jgi:predicted histone-like DNA-binding protein
MAIKFRAVQRAQPGVTGGGAKKYYAVPVMNGEWDIERLTRAIEKICTVSGADIRAVLYALVDVSTEGIDDGAIIRLGDLGSMRVTLGSEGRNTPDEVDASCIKKAGIIFTPGKRIKKTLDDVKYVKTT